MTLAHSNRALRLWHGSKKRACRRKFLDHCWDRNAFVNINVAVGIQCDPRRPCNPLRTVKKDRQVVNCLANCKAASGPRQQNQKQKNRRPDPRHVSLPSFLGWVEFPRSFRPDHCVCTATLVEPRTTPPASLNSTKMRLVWGTNGTLPLAVAKMAKVGVALALIVVVTLDPIDEMHWPLIGLVWQRLMASGKVAAPVVAVAVIEALAPTFNGATAK